MSARTSLVAVLTAAAVALAACGGGDDSGDDGAASTSSSKSPERASLTVATPFPSAVAFPELYVAIANDYFDKAALDVKVQPLDGSGSTLQALATGQVQVAVPSPGPIMQAAARGSDPVSVYTGLQQGIFSLVTTGDSGVKTLEDLRGKKVGVGALDGGEVPVVKGLLDEAGLKEGKDYTLLAVGDGGTASAAFKKGDIAAYGAAFVDLLILQSAGVEVTDLVPDGFKGGTDTHYTFAKKMTASDPDVVTRFGRALAQGEEWLHANPDAAFAKICKAFEEECADEKFARSMFDATLKLEKLPPEANGQWGWTNVEAVQQYADLLLEQGELKKPVDAAELFSNEFVAKFNDADKAAAEE